ncbi:MAG: cytochrome c3 family protein [Elusimicrobia bacterium]|nr:cytochrome c3 family protein [Elusimicrobiota bacterium]
MRRAALAGAFLAAVVGALWLARRLQAAEQPIAFNHKKHIGAGLECGVCHEGIAEGRVHAQFPRTEVCMTCHSSEDNPKTQAIRDYAAQKREIPWQRVYSVPKHVYFSHERHVGIAQLDCAVCHGDMAEKATPVAYQAVPIKMARCIACHQSRGVTRDCLACHR